MLHANAIFLLAVIVALGEGIGRVRVKSFSLGTSAVVFVALGFGHLGYVLPGDLQTLGLVLFVYSIGMAAGPGFLASFRQHGLRLSLGAATLVTAAIVTAIVVTWIGGFDSGTGAGLLAGAMTSTPGLAVAVERAGSTAAPAAYGVTYVFGVLGVIIAVRLLPRVLNIDIAAEEAAVAREVADEHPPVEVAHFEVTNPNLFDKRIDEIRITNIAPVTITRQLPETTSRRPGSSPMRRDEQRRSRLNIPRSWRC